MTEACSDDCAEVPIRQGGAGWLGLAATPTFAAMALLTWVLPGPPDMLCAAGGPGASLGGMVPMYLLMSAFHASPWLKLASRGRRERM